MKTTFKTVAFLLALSFGAVALEGCGGATQGRIVLGPYGEITSGTYNLDLTPVFQDQYPAPRSYNEEDLYKLPALEK